MTWNSWSLYTIELLMKFYKLLRSTYKFPYTIGKNLIIKQTTFFTQYYNVFKNCKNMKRKSTTYSSSFVDSLTHWRPGNTIFYFNKLNRRIKSQKSCKNRDEETIRRILGTLCSSHNLKWYKLIAKNWNKILFNRLILLDKKLPYSKKTLVFQKKKEKEIGRLCGTS